jgi:CheY-like chemotaxis protein
MKGMPMGRILAVDDQRYFRELIEGLLVEEGFEVQTCASGEEALRLLDHTVFDVIVKPTW